MRALCIVPTLLTLLMLAGCVHLKFTWKDSNGNEVDIDRTANLISMKKIKATLSMPCSKGLDDPVKLCPVASLDETGVDATSGAALFAPAITDLAGSVRIMAEKAPSANVTTKGNP